MPMVPSRLSPARILIVDDNSLGLLARKSVLEELGHAVTIASAPHDALDQFTRQPFDVVITDFKMPKMNGLELIVRMRKHNPDISVILISGFTDALGLDEETTGANIVIQKSSNEVPQLIRAVARLLRKPAPAQKKPNSPQTPLDPSTKRKRA
jgi:CheY-like chemotaxis protein